MNSVDKQYFDLLRYILKNGSKKTDRTGTGTISIFDHTMRFKMSEGFPLLTSKKMAWKSMVIELLWFLRGDTNIKWLVENGCNIWVGDAYKHYQKAFETRIDDTDSSDVKDYMYHVPNLSGSEYPSVTLFTRQEFIEKIKTDDKFAKKWGELGPVYGSQWRNWGGKPEPIFKNKDIKGNVFPGQTAVKGIDQISNLINDLKNNPDSRRLIVNAWNVAEIDKMVLPPCHYGFQCYTRELTLQERSIIAKSNAYEVSHDIKSIGFDNDKWLHEQLDSCNIPKRALSLKWTQRSCDCGLGIPFNIASYGLLLHLLSKEVNMIPEDLIFSGGDCHIYLNHTDQCKQQLKHKTYRLPTIEIANKSIFDIEYSDIILNNYESAPTINMPLSN